MSARTNIRNAIANALTTQGVVVTANILKGRNNTLASVSFPSCAVYAVHEDIEVRALAPANRQQYRVLQVMVEYFTAQTSTTLIDDLFDTGSDAVEAAVLSDVTLGGLCRDLHLTSVDYVIEPDENFRWGTARHNFNCIYLTTD
ncbi:MAG: hypothetical protein FJ184_01990 [Gammaproteobacteria bacterium]|nr:hypothetical protein [Gammaproteobacteria bacterium]